MEMSIRKMFNLPPWSHMLLPVCILYAHNVNIQSPINGKSGEKNTRHGVVFAICFAINTFFERRPQGIMRHKHTGIAQRMNSFGKLIYIISYRRV